MEKLNYQEIANTQRWKNLRGLFAQHDDKREREAILAMIRQEIRKETREYQEIAKRHNENMSLLCVLDNYADGLIALKDVDGIEAY